MSVFLSATGPPATKASQTASFVIMDMTAILHESSLMFSMLQVFNMNHS